MQQEQLANSQETESKSDYSRNLQEQSSSKKKFILQKQLFQNSNFDGFEKKDYYLIQNESYKNFENVQNIQNETINFEQINDFDQNTSNSNNYINIYDDARQRMQNQNSSMKNEEYIQNQCDDQSTLSDCQKQSIHKKESKKRIMIRETLQGKAPDNLVEKFTSKNLLVSKQSRSAIQLLNDQNLSGDFDVLQIGNNEENLLNQNNSGSLRLQNQKIITKSQQSLGNQEIREDNPLKCQIFGWGKNFMEQFNYDKNKCFIPIEIMNMGNLQIKQTACGLSHALFLTQQNEIYAIGQNQYSQLGLSDGTNIKTLAQVDINIPQFFIKQKTIFEISQICTSNCSYHSIILLTSRFNQILLGSGLNSYGQLGLRFNQENEEILQGFYEIQNINYEIEDNMIIVKIGCGKYFSSLILAIVGEQQGKREELWTWGKIGSNKNSEIGEIYKIQIQGCSKDMLCGQNSILLLMNNGELFVINEFYEQSKIRNLPKVVEISSSTNKFAAMDINNYIYVWDQDEINGAVTKIQSQVYLKNLTFQRLTIGEDFGHTVDEYGNLYGWGHNKNGELGTGDNIPRPQICQIKIFDGQDNYMRCDNIFTGQQFVIGIFQPVKNQLVKSSSRIQISQSNTEQYCDISQNDKKKERKSLSQFNERINQHQQFQEQPKKQSHSANNVNRIQIPVQKNQMFLKNKNYNHVSKIIDSNQDYEQNLEQKYDKIAKINKNQQKLTEEAAFNYKTGIFDETYQNITQLNDQNLEERNIDKRNTQRIVSERRIKKLSELEREAQIRKTAEAIDQYRQVYNSFNKNLQIINSIDSQLKEQQEIQNNPQHNPQKAQNRFVENNFEPSIENSLKLNLSQGQYKTKTIQSTIDADTSNSQLQQLKYSPDILVTKLQPNQTIIDDNQAVSPPIVQSNVHTLRAPPKENFKSSLNQEYMQNQTFQNRPRIPPRQFSNRMKKNADEIASTEQSDIQLEKFKRTNAHFQRQRELSWNDEKSNQLSVKRVQGDLSWRNQNMNIIKSPITTNQNPISMISDSKPHSSFNVTKVFAQNNLIQDRIDEISNRNTNPFKNKSNLQYSQISESFNDIQKSQKFGHNEMYINETFRTSSQNNENSNHYHQENYYKGLEFQDKEEPYVQKKFKILTKQEWEKLPTQNKNLSANFNVPDEKRGKSHDQKGILNSQQNQNYNQFNQREYQNNNHRIIQAQGNNLKQKEQYDLEYYQKEYIHINQQHRNPIRNGQYEFNLQSENFSGEQSQFNDTKHNINFNDKILIGLQYQNASNKNTTPRSYNQNGYMDTFNQDEQFDKINNKIPFFMNPNDKINRIEQSKQQSVQRSLLSTASLGKKGLVNTNLRQSISSLCQSQNNIENNEILLFNEYQNPPTVSSIDQQYAPNQNFEKLKSVDSRNQKSSIDDINMARQYSINQLQYQYPYCQTPQEFNQKYPAIENKENLYNINIAQDQNANNELISKNNDNETKQKSYKNPKDVRQNKKLIKMKQKIEKRENYSEREQQIQIEKQEVKMRQTENKISKKVTSISTTRESKRDSLTAVSTISHSKTDLQDVIVNVGIKYGHQNSDSNNQYPPQGISNYNLDNIDLSSIALNNLNAQNYNQNYLSSQKGNNQNIQNLLKTIHNQEVLSQDHLEESIQFKKQQNQIFEDIQEKMQNTKKKLNKYKKKLKKYIQINQENERDIQFYKNQNEQLKKQNEVLLQCDEKKEGATMIFLQEQLHNFQDQIFQMRKEYQSQIDQLTEENQQLQEVLQQKEDNQRLLQEKFQFVESQLQHLDSSLINQTEANQQLKQQIIQFKSKEKLQNQNNEEIMKDYQRMNQENQSMMIEYGKMKEEINHLQKINQSFENALKDQSKVIQKQNQGIFEAVCQQINENQSMKKQEEPIVFMLNQDSRDSLNMPSSASFSQGRALDRNMNAIPYKNLIDYEMQKKENIQSCQLQNVQSQGNHNSAALSFQPSLSQLNEDFKEQQNHYTVQQNQKQFQQMNINNNSLDLSDLNKSYNSKKLGDNHDFRNTYFARQNDHIAYENNGEAQDKTNKTQTAISSSLQTINTQETQNNYLYQICPNEVDYQGYDLHQNQRLQKSDLKIQNQNKENSIFQLPSRTLQLDEKYTKIIQQNQNESYLRESMQFSQIQNLDQSNLFFEKNTDCSLEQNKFQNNQKSQDSKTLANHGQEQPKQNYRDFGSQFPNFEYVQKKYLQCPETQNFDSNKHQQLNQLPCQVQKTLSPQNSYVNPIHENIKKDEHVRVQTSVGKENQMNVGSTSQSTFNKMFTNNIHQISLSSKVSEFETQYNPNQIRIKDQSLSYQEKFRELSFEQQEKLINFIQGNQLSNNNQAEEIHSKSIIESNSNQQKGSRQQVQNVQNDQKPVRLEYSSNFNRYLNYDPNGIRKQEIISSLGDEELISHQSLNNTSRHYKSKSEKGTSSGIQSNTHKSRSLNVNSVSYSAKNCPNSVKQSKMIDYKDSILSKFEKKTNDKINFDIKKRDQRKPIIFPIQRK